jgi:ketosteroid isomerase-like protein
MSERNIQAVRSIWRAYGRGGLDAVVRVADPEVEWVPYGGEGRIYRGHDGLREFMERVRPREGVSAEPYSFMDLDPHVLVYGHYDDGEEDRPVFWLYVFRDERLVRFEAFADQDSAIAAARRAGD